MFSAGAAIDQLLQSRRDVLLTYKEPRREVHSVHREKRLGSLEIPYQLINSVQRSERPLFISLDSRWEEKAVERKRKKKQKRTRSVDAQEKGRYSRKRRRVENSVKQKSKEDKVPTQGEQASELALNSAHHKANCGSNLVYQKNKEKHSKDNDFDKDINKNNSKSETRKQKRKTTSRYSLQDSTKATKASTSLSLAIAAKHALMYSGHQKTASATTIATEVEVMPKSNSNKAMESEESILMINKQKKSIKQVISDSNSSNKESSKEQLSELGSTKKLLTRSRTELPKRKWTARKLHNCLLKIRKAVSLRRHWRVRDFVLCTSTNNKKSNKLKSDKSNCSTCAKQGTVPIVKAQYSALMLRRRREALLENAFAQSLQIERGQIVLDKEAEQSKDSTHEKNDNNIESGYKADKVKQTELSKASLMAIHSFWSIVKCVLVQRQASLENLLHSLQTTHNDHTECKSLNLRAARSFPLFGALVKLEWVHYVKPSISLNKRTQQRATLQIVKAQYGIVIHEMLRTLEIALLPTSRSTRETLTNWLIGNNSINNINDKTVKCPAKAANTCSVAKLYLASSGTRGSAVKKMSRKLRLQGNNKKKEMYVDIMCSYVGEMASNVIDKVETSNDSNDSSCKNKYSEEPQCEQHNNHDVCNSVILLARMRHRYL